MSSLLSTHPISYITAQCNSRAMGQSQSTSNHNGIDNSLLDLYRIKPSSSCHSKTIWHLNPRRSCRVPAHLDTLLEDYQLALTPAAVGADAQTHFIPTVHVNIRPRVHVILHLMLAEAKKRALESPGPDLNANVAERFRTLFWGYEQVIAFPESFQMEGSVLHCKIDYILWYGCQQHLDTNLVIVRAEEPIKDRGEYKPLLAAMVESGLFGMQWFSTIEKTVWLFLHLNKNYKYCLLELGWIEVSIKLLRGGPERGLFGKRSIKNAQQRDYSEETVSVIDDAGSASSNIGPNTTDMQVFQRIENRVRDIAKRFKLDAKVNAELKRAIDLTRTESQKGAGGAIPTKAVTSIPPTDAEELFHLKREGKSSQAWYLAATEKCRVPEYLRALLADYDLVFGRAEKNEALIRARTDAALFTTLAAKKEEFGQYGLGKASSKRSSTQRLASYKSLHFGIETKLELPWLYDGSPKDAETNMIVVEAKRPVQVQEGKYQALAYMAIIHHARKKTGRTNCAIYGISTDSCEWDLIRLSPQGTVYFLHTDWHDGDQIAIVSHIHKILGEAALLLPVPTKTLSRQKTVEAEAGFVVSDSGHDCDGDED
ncbi:hypothetical protein BDW62DRAFT_198074 [Aspergillus aurantiobrunneus]